MLQWRYRPAECTWSEPDKDELFLLFSQCVASCVFFCLGICLCIEGGATHRQNVFVEYSWHRTFRPVGSAVFPFRKETHRVRGEPWGSPIMPLLCPCGCINSAIAEATVNSKVLHKTLWYKGLIDLSPSVGREEEHFTKKSREDDKFNPHTFLWPSVCSMYIYIHV